MFDIYCFHCGRNHLLFTHDIRSTHSTSNGPVAHVQCPKGHHLVKEFRSNRTRTLESWGAFNHAIG